MSQVQSVIFDKRLNTKAYVREWIKQYNFTTAYGIDSKQSKNFHRVRQFPPTPGARYITKNIDPIRNIDLILEF
jgi:hypothetical protein